MAAMISLNIEWNYLLVKHIETIQVNQMLQYHRLLSGWDIS